MKLSKYLEVVCLTALLVFGVQACGGDPPPAAPCPESQELCDGLCYDLDTTANHCGACGTTCAAGEVCNAGTCEFGCPTGLTECDGGCVDTQTSGTNCGACGAACAAGEVCDAGACSTSCGQGLTVCDGGCVDTQGDETNCGDCGTTCEGNARCQQGMCVAMCGPGLESCDGACVDTSADREHCGECGAACAAGEVCNQGSCELSCPASQEICGGACVDTQRDADFCGDCDTACAAGELCQSGSCVLTCEPGRSICDEACVDLQFDDNYCGDCDTACSASQDCVQGVCVEPCPFDNESRCGAECVDMDNDPAHCGRCGLACVSGEACVDGACEPCADCPRFTATFDGGNSSSIFDIAPDSQGNIYAVGGFSNTIVIADEFLDSRGEADGLLIKFNPNGNILWARTFGGTSLDEGQKVLVDATDHVYVLGRFNEDAVFEGTALEPVGGSDIFLAKFDPEGALLWIDQFGTAQSDIAAALRFDPSSGGLIVGANLADGAGGYDMHIARYDTNGNRQGDVTFGGSGSGFLTDAIVDDTGAVYFTGTHTETIQWDVNTSTTATGVTELFVVKIDAANALSWVAEAPLAAATSFSRGGGLALDANGGLYLGGFVGGDTSFGMQTVTSYSPDAFLAKLDANGAWQWVSPFEGAGADAIGALKFLGSKLYFVGSTNGGFRGGTFATALEAALFGVAELDGAIAGITPIVSSRTTFMTALAADAQGNLYIGGRGSGVVSFGKKRALLSGNIGAFTARYDADITLSCPTLGHEVCGGVCTNPTLDDAHCGGCGNVCAAGAGEICVDGSCQVPVTGVVLSEVHVGSDAYFIIENTSSASIDLGQVHYYIYDFVIGSPRAAGPLASILLGAGESIIVTELGYDVAGPEINLPEQIFLPGNPPLFQILLCSGPCDPRDGRNVLDALRAGDPQPYLPGGLTFEPGGAPMLSDRFGESYIRAARGGSNPTFLQSDWSVGPKTR